MSKLTTSQIKHLNERLCDADEAAKKKIRSIPGPVEPEAIANARRLVSEWEEAAYREQDLRVQNLRDEVLTRRKRAQEELQFGAPEKALAACKEFEAWVEELKV